MSSSLLLIALIFVVAAPSLVRGRVYQDADSRQLRIYIVHVLPPENVVFSTSDELRSWHESFLPETTSASDDEPRLLYSYTHAYSGFSARLSEDDLKAMEKKPGFVSAMPEKTYQLLTTHTPDFLGLHLGSGFWKRSNLGKGVIIGLLDSGVTSDHVSFHDDGVPPPPSTWKGKCAHGDVCNNKLIGTWVFGDGASLSRSSMKTLKPASDSVGHGTHTSSTAAGNFVKAASVSGLANGTAAGVAPLAHLAMYTVCGFLGCPGSAILAGLDAAVKDGVDVISLSLGGDPTDFDQDPIAIGGFRAADRGIFVSAAGGNRGPAMKTVSNTAPWLLTVAASTTDRRIKVTVKLGNGEEFDGESLYQPRNYSSKPFELAYIDNSNSRATCSSLDGVNLEKKVVVCDVSSKTSRLEKEGNVRQVGGVGMILVNTELEGYTTFVDHDILPTSHVSFWDGSKIKSYIKSARNPTATFIFKGAVLGNATAPEIAYFSSRGPNVLSNGILKPDVAGPGVNILAAWPADLSGASENSDDTRGFQMISGTSMATPHLSGVAALVKSAHPDWSPSAIKSAILTTAYNKANDGQPIKDEQHKDASIYATGSGHVDPTRVADPGLVYDIETDEYISYLCGLGYGDDRIGAIVGPKISCSKYKKISEWELNYPNILVPLSESSKVSVSRTVTNVGDARSTYKAEVEAPKGVTITVSPDVLQFSKTNEKKSFNVTVASEGALGDDWKGQLKWLSGDYAVRSIIANMPRSTQLN